MRHPAVPMNAARDVGGGRFVLSFPFLALTLPSPLSLRAPSHGTSANLPPRRTCSWGFLFSELEGDTEKPGSLQVSSGGHITHGAEPLVVYLLSRV